MDIRLQNNHPVLTTCTPIELEHAYRRLLRGWREPLPAQTRAHKGCEFTNSLNRQIIIQAPSACRHVLVLPSLRLLVSATDPGTASPRSSSSPRDSRVRTGTNRTAKYSREQRELGAEIPLTLAVEIGKAK